ATKRHALDQGGEELCRAVSEVPERARCGLHAAFRALLSVLRGLGVLRPAGLQPRPVELDAVTGAIRREGESVLDPERLGDVANQPEAVRFEIRAVGGGGQKMHGYVVGSV